MNREEMLDGLAALISDGVSERDAAIRLSIQKWKANLEIVMADKILDYANIDGYTCALCELFHDNEDEVCLDCPLRQRFGTCATNTWSKIYEVVFESWDLQECKKLIKSLIKDLESLKETCFRVTDCAYNRKWYPELIGNQYPRRFPPSYVAVEEI